jgi:FkbM family methyltransferase
MRTGAFEKKVKRRLEMIHGDLFVDVGANHKRYARILRNNFNRIITIDPNPKWNADLQIALSNFNGKGPFYIGQGNGSADSLVKNPHILGVDYQNGTVSFEVEVRRWDDLCLDADLVKIDVENAELQVIGGMNKFLPKNVCVEIHDERRETDVLTEMSKRGYSRERIDETHWLFKRDDHH